MTNIQFEQPTNEASLASAEAAPGRPPRTIILRDGQGGLLALDVTCPALSSLVDAYRCLIEGAVPPNTSLIKVDTGNEVYLLSRRRAPAGGEIIRVANLYDPAQDVRLPRELADGIIALVARLLRLHHPTLPAGARAGH